MSTDATTRGVRSVRAHRARLWIVLGVLVIGATMLAVWPSARHVVPRMTEWFRESGISDTSLEKLDQYGQVPDFTLVERSGRPVTLADLIGKVWVADFIYTECPDPNMCPLQSAHMARLQADWAGEPDVRLVSISVDPEHDTPEVLSEYAARFQADPERWLFLTGAKDSIYRLALEGFHLGVVDREAHAQEGTGRGLAWLGPASAWAHSVPNAEHQTVLHSTRFALVDRQAQIRGYYDGTDWQVLERLQANVKILLREPAPAR
jgi:protein SCO1